MKMKGERSTEIARFVALQIEFIFKTYLTTPRWNPLARQIKKKYLLFCTNSISPSKNQSEGRNFGRYIDINTAPGCSGKTFLRVIFLTYLTVFDTSP